MKPFVPAPSPLVMAIPSVAAERVDLPAALRMTGAEDVDVRDATDAKPLHRGGVLPLIAVEASPNRDCPNPGLQGSEFRFQQQPAPSPGEQHFEASAVAL